MRARGTNRGERECGEEGGTGGREYLSESLTDYLYTYMLTSVIPCLVCFSFCGCGSACIGFSRSRCSSVNTLLESAAFTSVMCVILCFTGVSSRQGCHVQLSSSGPSEVMVLQRRASTPADFLCSDDSTKSKKHTAATACKPPFFKHQTAGAEERKPEPPEQEGRQVFI